MSSYIGLSQNSKDVLQVTIIMTSHPQQSLRDCRTNNVSLLIGSGCSFPTAMGKLMVR